MQFKKRVSALVLIFMLTVSTVTVATEHKEIKRLSESAFVPVPTFPAVPTPLPIITDIFRSVTPTKPIITVPENKPIVVEKIPVVAISTKNTLTGKASWYCRPGTSICTKGFASGGSYGAAGPKLRVALCGSTSCKSYKGRTVYVNGFPITLIDYCQCYWREPHEKLIDLYYSAWITTSARKGVTIRW